MKNSNMEMMRIYLAITAVVSFFRACWDVTGWQIWRIPELLPGQIDVFAGSLFASVFLCFIGAITLTIAVMICSQLIGGRSD